MKSKTLAIGLLTGLIVFTSCNNNTQTAEETQITQTQKEDEPKELSEEEKRYEEIKSSYELLGCWAINNGITNLSYDYEIYSSTNETIGVMRFKKMKFEFDGQTLMTTDSDSIYHTNGQGQLNGQYGTSTDTKTTWEKVVDQELIYRQNEENEKAALQSTWPFPLDRPAEATLRVDSSSDEFKASVPNAMDYRHLYYGGA